MKMIKAIVESFWRLQTYKTTFKFRPNNLVITSAQSIYTRGPRSRVLILNLFLLILKLNLLVIIILYDSTIILYQHHISIPLYYWNPNSSNAFQNYNLGLVFMGLFIKSV